MKYVAQITVFVETNTDDRDEARSIADEVCSVIESKAEHVDGAVSVSAQVYAMREEDDDEEARP
jgi:hypothetical protein